MSKKSWFGSDEAKAEADKADASKADADKDNPSTAGSQDPNTPSEPGAAPAHPVNILRDDRNVETDVGSVNPQNNAAAQVPAAIPLDQDPATAEERAKDAERLRSPKSDKDRADALKAWGREVRLRGNVTSADWERFQELTGERTAPPSADDIARAERERDQGKDAAQKRGAGTTRAE